MNGNGDSDGNRNSYGLMDGDWERPRDLNRYWVRNRNRKWVRDRHLLHVGRVLTVSEKKNKQQLI